MGIILALKEKHPAVRSLLFSILFLISLFVIGQNNQAEYLEAKRQFGLGNYSEASLSFKSLSNDQMFGAYASFYYALSSLKMDQLKTAEEMFKQIQVKYPDWDQQSEVSYWLTHSLFLQKKYWKAFGESEKLPKGIKEFVIDEFLSEMTIPSLDSAYALNPDNSYIGNYYAKAIKDLPYEEQDRRILLELSEKFDLSLSISENLPLIKKEEYGIAVVLPFMFDSLSTPQTVIRNTIIFDLYQGMNLAQKDLEDRGIKLNLFPFDTKKKGEVTYDLIKGKKLDEADVIIGPLYSGPSRYISAFSKENRITMINPVSSNPSIVEGNPYAYLFKPSYLTQGEKAAEFAAKKFTDNKKVFIF